MTGYIVQADDPVNIYFLAGSSELLVSNVQTCELLSSAATRQAGKLAGNVFHDVV